MVEIWQGGGDRPQECIPGEIDLRNKTQQKRNRDCIYIFLYTAEITLYSFVYALNQHLAYVLTRMWQQPVLTLNISWIFYCLCHVLTYIVGAYVKERFETRWKVFLVGKK